MISLTDYLTTRELAELLRIKERKVYDLAASGAVPCSRATGKLLFPRQGVEQWIAAHATSGKTGQPVSVANVILGSHDPLLEWAIRESRCGLATCFDSSLDGLDKFSSLQGLACGLHVRDNESGDWNRPVVESRFSSQAVVLAHWAKRRRGLIVERANPLSITGLADLKGRKVIPRQPEAGSQILLESLLQQEGVKAGEIDWLTPARSELDAVLAVQEGKAQATFGLASLAVQFNLDFMPLIEEQFDLLVYRRAWFEPAWQTLVEFCRTEVFRERAIELAGYDIGGIFQVRYNAPA